jgi:hypothetical protein
MNGMNFGEQTNTIDGGEGTAGDTNNPVVNSDNVPVFADPIPGTPEAGTIAAVGPKDEKIVHETPAGEMMSLEAPIGAHTGSPAPLPLLNREESEHFRSLWNEIQGKFVDEPRSAVQQADELVSEVVKKIIQMYASQHASLESQWNQGKDVSTEHLRQALQHYRAFFNRLVT